MKFYKLATMSLIIIAGCSVNQKSNAVTGVIYTPNQVPWIRIETQLVYNQCDNGISSVYINNGYPYKYRVAVLKQKNTDEVNYYVLGSDKFREWIGCTNDGYSYSVKNAERLP